MDDMEKHKLKMIIDMCESIMQDMSGGDEEDNQEGEAEAVAEPVAAVKITKVSEAPPEDLMSENDDEDEEEEELPKRSFGRLRIS